MAKNEVTQASRQVELVNRNGLHARPSSRFVRVANAYPCDVVVEFGNQKVNGKSVIEMMTLGAAVGSRLLITATGKGAEKALLALEELVRNRFGEKE